MIKVRIMALIMVFGLSGCDEEVTPKTANKAPLPETKTAVLVPVKKALITFPKHLHPIPGMVTYTHHIGTPDHPTIDGGIINTTDKTPVNSDDSVPIQRPVSHHRKTKSPIPFKDDWATDAKVKQLLLAASQSGKLEYVLKKSEEMALPASVAFVPMVESHYDNAAISPKGAGGAWQLMPSTAKDYGLPINERFLFKAETDVALKILQDLHHEFSNWSLAFAAYNAGAQRVKNALQKNPQAATVEELDLPQETKTYVQRMIGLNRKIMEGAVHA